MPRALQAEQRRKQRTEKRKKTGTNVNNSKKSGQTHCVPLKGLVPQPANKSINVQKYETPTDHALTAQNGELNIIFLRQKKALSNRTMNAQSLNTGRASVESYWLLHYR